MFQPAKTKYRKWHRGRNRQYGIATSCTKLVFGSYGLKAVSGGEINSRQLEAARKAITHHFKRGGKIWIRIFPHQPITRKAAEVPMGAGKGSVEFYVALVKKGNVLMEIDGIPEDTAKKAIYLAGSKLPVRTKFITSKH
ncbi:50S ribosomal protein L16 [Candidatus Peregrinibacteria bacterium]|nr:50S ribosomal protein L16 [Candidatus Peregrinibacteria bacterium]